MCHEQLGRFGRKRKLARKRENTWKDSEAELKFWKDLRKDFDFGSCFLKLGVIKPDFAQNIPKQIVRNAESHFQHVFVTEPIPPPNTHNKTGYINMLISSFFK